MKALLAVMLLVAASPPASPSRVLRIVGPAERFAPGVASTQYDEIRLTLSPDGKTALWFSRNRPGGPGGYDIWVSRNDGQRWRPATPVPFNTPGRDFDPALFRRWPRGVFLFGSRRRPGRRRSVSGQHGERRSIRGASQSWPRSEQRGR
jgi:hypothetical protein